jgi:hypothetical protein
MIRYLRYGFIVGGLTAVLLTIGLYFQMSWATSLWMWPDSRLTYIFVASITAAIAAPLLWMALAGEWSAVAGGAINLLIQAGGITLFLLQLTVTGVEQNLLPHILVIGAFALVNLGLFFWSRRIPPRDTRPTPRPVYYAFAVFVVLLVIFAVALLLKSPNIFPWPLHPETSVIIGWVFAGTAVYFAYPFIRRGWFNAYDLILILPFLGHFSAVLPEHRLSLTIYTGVLVFSGVLAVYYLFVHPSSRIWGYRQTG